MQNQGLEYNMEGGSPETSTLDKELQTAKECWEQEKEPSPGKNTPIAYPIPNGHPWKHP